MNKETSFGAGNGRMGVNMDIQLDEESFLIKERRPIDEKAGYSLMQFGNFVNIIAEGMTLDYDALQGSEDESISQLDKIGGPDYANDINAWMNLVIPESALPKSEIREVGGSRIVLDPSVSEIPTEIDREYSAESILIGVAIAEAKLLVVSQLMKDVYPALAVDAKKKLDELHATSEQILKAKENDKTLKFSLSGGLKGGVNKKVVPILVIGTFVLSACVGSVSAGDKVPTAVALESTKTPVVHTIEATATKTEIPTATTTATALPPTETQIPPTETQIPPTETQIPTATATERVYEKLELVKDGSNPEKYLSVPFEYFIDGTVLANEMEQSEGFSDKAIFSSVVENPPSPPGRAWTSYLISPGDANRQQYQIDPETRPFHADFFYKSEFPNGKGIWVVSEKVLNADGTTGYMHFAYPDKFFLGDKLNWYLTKIIDDKSYLTPRTNVDQSVFESNPNLRGFYYDNSVESLAMEWCETGILPYGLQNMVMFPETDILGSQ